MTRAVAMNNTTTMRIGMTVQASSICALPYTWAGSRPASDALSRNFTTEYTSKLATMTNMIPVMASTNIERSKINFAGVPSGAKMFVRLAGEDDDPAAAALVENQNRNA